MSVKKQMKFGQGQNTRTRNLSLCSLANDKIGEKSKLLKRKAIPGIPKTNQLAMVILERVMYKQLQ